MFDAQDVQVQGEKTPKQRRGDGGASKQSGQSTFMERLKDVLLLWKIVPHHKILLQCPKKRNASAHNVKDKDKFAFAT